MPSQARRHAPQQARERPAPQAQRDNAIPLPQHNPLRTAASRHGNAAVQALMKEGDGSATGEEQAGPTSSLGKKVYANNAERGADWKSDLSKRQKSDMEAFHANYVANHQRYKAVEAKTGIPARLVAAIHWRESNGDFGTYLHQGDPLGKKARNEPRNIPIFHDWESAAVHALGMKSAVQSDLGIDAGTKDEAALATYAEFYNGLGYHQRGKPSPYVWAGTDQYDRGKYVADGRYSRTHEDQQLGVVPMMKKAGDFDAALASTHT